MTQYFYEYGCAPAGIVDTAAAIKALDSRQLTDDVARLVWPQTATAYLAMHDLKDRPAHVTDFVIGGLLLGEWQTVPTRRYWLTVAYDLFAAAVLVDRATSSSALRKTLLSGQAPAVEQLLAHARNASLAGDQTGSAWKLETLLVREFGFYGLLWALRIWVAERRSVQQALNWVRGRGCRSDTPHGRREPDPAPRTKASDHTSGKRQAEWF